MDFASFRTDLIKRLNAFKEISRKGSMLSERDFNEKLHAFQEISTKGSMLSERDFNEKLHAFEEISAEGSMLYVQKLTNMAFLSCKFAHARSPKALRIFGTFQKVATLYSTFLHFHLLV